MESKIIRAEEVAKELDVSVPYAYKIIRKLNDELKAKGYITIAGRVNRQYFNERLYGAERNDENALRKMSKESVHRFLSGNGKRKNEELFSLCGLCGGNGKKG